MATFAKRRISDYFVVSFSVVAVGKDGSPANTCSKLTIETIERGVKHVQS